MGGRLGGAGGRSRKCTGSEAGRMSFVCLGS